MASRQKLKPRVLSRKRGLKTKLGNQSEIFIKAVLVWKVMFRQENKEGAQGTAGSAVPWQAVVEETPDRREIICQVSVVVTCV